MSEDTGNGNGNDNGTGNGKEDTVQTLQTPRSLMGVVLDGRYRLDMPIATGGHGQVWRGMQLSVNRPVAIKLMLPKHLQNTRILRRFEREAKYACRLSHPNLVIYYDHGYDQRRALAYIVMEYLDGRTLSRELAVVRPMDIERVCSIVEQVCAGLMAAHQANLLHRDIKPSNIMLIESRTGLATDLVKVVDFGLAKGFGDGAGQDTPLTKEGYVLGTPHYLSPEQVRGGKLSPATDLYSLACTTYHLLTGTRVFEGDNHFEIATKQVTQEPDLLSDRYPQGTFPEPLEDLMAWALAKDPQDRPSLSAFANQFRRIVEATKKPWLHLPKGKRTAPERPKRTPRVTFVQIQPEQAAPGAPATGAVDKAQAATGEQAAGQAQTPPTTPVPAKPEQEQEREDTTPRKARVRLPLPDPKKAPGYKERKIETTPSMSVVKPHPQTALVQRQRWILAGAAVLAVVSLGGGVGCVALLFL